MLWCYMDDLALSAKPVMYKPGRQPTTTTFHDGMVYLWTRKTTSNDAVGKGNPSHVGERLGHKMAWHAYAKNSENQKKKVFFFFSMGGAGRTR